MEVVHLYVSRGGISLGMYTVSQIRNWLQDGTFDGTEWGWHERLVNWEPLITLVQVLSHGGEWKKKEIATGTATPKQRKFLEDLHVSIPSHLSKEEASQLIQSALSRREEAEFREVVWEEYCNHREDLKEHFGARLPQLTRTQFGKILAVLDITHPGWDKRGIESLGDVMQNLILPSVEM